MCRPPSVRVPQGIQLSEHAVLRERGLPCATADRLVRCHHLCLRLRELGREFIASRELGRRLGCTPALVRRDLARIGKLGTRGPGYPVSGLLGALGTLLGKAATWDVVLVGAGNLGTALLSHVGFRQRGFRFVAVFDADPEAIGRTRGDLVVQDVLRIPAVLSSVNARIGVIAVPARAAQWVATVLAENGVRAILNMAPTSIRPKKAVAVSNVDLATELEKLCLYLTAAAADVPGGAQQAG